MNTTLKFIILVFCCLSFIDINYAQENCASKLERARRLYDESPQLIPEILKDCRKDKSLSREEHIEILELLAKSHLQLNNTAQAEFYYIRILNIKPEYSREIKLEESPDLYYMAQELRRHSFLTFFFKAGPGLSAVEQLVDYDLNAAPLQTQVSATEDNYDEKLVSHYEAGAEFNLLRSNWDIAAGLSYDRYKLDYLGNAQLDNDSILSANFEFNERQQWLGIPVLLKYSFYGNNRKRLENRPEKNYVPYAFIGLSPQFLLKARMEGLKLTGPKVDESIHQEQESGLTLNTGSFPDLRNNFNMSFIAGGGLKRKIGDVHAFFELSFNTMLFNVSNTADKFNAGPTEPSDPLYRAPVYTLQRKFRYIEDDFRFLRLNISFGLSYSFYSLYRTVH